jgi:hypothetical protein
MNDFFRRKTVLLECIAVILLAVAALQLHWISLRHAGGLWRDEICVVNIATLPTLAQVWQAMPHDHCPMLFLLLVRGWMAVGMGNTDTELRILGLACGILLVAALCMAGRMMGKGLPLISLSLAGLNFTVIRYGDSIRAYGLGTALVVITMGLIWRFIETPNRWRWLLASLLGFLIVQTLYQNSFLLLAMCLGGAAVCLRRRHRLQAIGVLSIGLVPAVSLLPYVASLRHAQSWWLLSKAGIGVDGFLSKISEATGMLMGAWAVLIVFAVFFGLGLSLIKRPRGVMCIQPELLLFASLSLVMGLAGFGIFIKFSGLPTEPWYYIPALVFAAVCCDVIVARVHQTARVWVLIGAVSTFLYAFISAQPVLRMKQTNGDLVAAQVAQRVKTGDLIVIHPWYYGITFARYYKGTVPWMTLPPLTDYRFHRYDLFKLQMQSDNPNRLVFEKMETTLRSGHRLWIVGSIPHWTAYHAAPKNPPPAPNGPQGWFDEPYTQIWGDQLSCFLTQHAALLKPITSFPTNSVNPMETMRLLEASNWRNSVTTNWP